MNGFFNILKPPGMTSSQVVGFMRRLTGENRVGHAGTLDPEAAGVLPIMAGRAARLFDYLVDKEKSYVAECAFGCRTDTQDAQGTVIATGTDYPSLDRVRAAAGQLTGDILQRPGMYSAIKKDGKPMYLRARQGETVEVPERLVHVERLEILAEMPDHGFMMQVDCGRGTYIRSICEDLGHLCGCPAHMRFLLRTRSGFFTIRDAITLEEASAAARENRLDSYAVPVDAPLQHLRAVHVPESFARLAANGAALPVQMFAGQNVKDAEILRVYLGNAFLGLAGRDGEWIRWKVLFPQND